jgi:arsenite methyltransferase
MQTTDSTKEDQIRQQVRERYGAVARTESNGCCGTASNCCASPTSPDELGYKPGDADSVPEGSELGLGCGNPTAIASIRPGETILDLGSGGGFDCFLAAQQTGANGRVIGVDMTPEMISKARANAAKGGYHHVEFRLGEIENLPVADNMADLAISNCVINLSPNKPRVFAELFRALKPGGRIAVSDIVATADIPEELRADFVAYTGCVAGASKVADLEQWLKESGFTSVDIEIKESSRRFIDEWVPGKNTGSYVASATIQARKPGGPVLTQARIVDFDGSAKRPMRASEFKSQLERHPAHALRFVLPDGDHIPAHAHITEAGRVDKTFVDCGSTVRRIATCTLQAWVADDVDHRLSPAKLARVLDIAAPIFNGDDLAVEIEYEDCAISQFPVLEARVSEGVLSFYLGEKHTDCLARDVCLPQGPGCGTDNGCCR